MAGVKISGKKTSLPSLDEKKWKITQRPGGWLIAESADGIRKRFALDEKRGKFSASLSGYLWNGEWLVEDRNSGKAGGRDDGDLTAQFPGKVRKILVRDHDSVQEGDTLLLIEAMKMEFAVRAPSTGKILRVLVQEGQQLLPGDRFLEMEA